MRKSATFSANLSQELSRTTKASTIKNCGQPAGYHRITETRKKMKTLPLVLIVLLFSMGCTTMNTGPPADKRTALQTFDWFEHRLEGAINQENNRKTQAMVEQLLEQKLLEKKFRKVSASETPDILIGWYSNVQSEVKEVQINRHYKSRGYGTLTGYVDQNAAKTAAGKATVVFKQGTLIVDKINPVTKEVTWRNSVSGAFKNQLSEAATFELLDRAINKLMKKFPEAS